MKLSQLLSVGNADTAGGVSQRYVVPFLACFLPFAQADGEVDYDKLVKSFGS